MTIALTPSDEQRIRDLMTKSGFSSEAELIRSALSRFESWERLRTEIQAGLDELDGGQRIAAEDVFAELRQLSARP
jgi:antitoxin ParD1/3/4